MRFLDGMKPFVNKSLVLWSMLTTFSFKILNDSCVILVISFGHNSYSS